MDKEGSSFWKLTLLISRVVENEIIFRVPCYIFDMRNSDALVQLKECACAGTVESISLTKEYPRDRLQNAAGIIRCQTFVVDKFNDSTGIVIFNRVNKHLHQK